MVANNNTSIIRGNATIQSLHVKGKLKAFNRSRPNQIADPGPKSGPARKSESRGPENGVSRWRRPNSDIYSQNHHFGLVYDMIYQFLGMEAKNYKLQCSIQSAFLRDSRTKNHNDPYKHALKQKVGGQKWPLAISVEISSFWSPQAKQ